VIRLRRPQRLQERARPTLPGVRLVGGRGGRDERERVEDLRLGVGGLPRDEPGHRALVGEHARALVDALVVRVESRDGGDVGALPRRGGGGEALCVSRRPPPAGEQCGRAVGGTRRVGPAAEGEPPVRHRARRIRRQHVVESADRRAELERVEQRDGAVEPRRDRRAARRGEVHGPQPRVGARVLGVGLRGGTGGEQRGE
jgi:hypothetical protein